MQLRNFIFTIAIFILPLLTRAQTFSGTGGNITNGATIQNCFTINATGLPTAINSNFGLAQLCLTITHPNTDELEILLTAPDGTIVPISIQNGGSGNNYSNTCFTGTAANHIKFGSSPFNGTYLPEGYLGAVNNGQNPNGAWRLCITDRRTVSNVGTLNSWNLTFNNTPAPQPPAIPACAQTLPTGISCSGATSVCDFSGLCGSTTSNGVNDWAGSNLNSCFNLENNTFVKFVAAAPTVSFAVWVPTTNLTFLGGGIQMLFFSGTCGSGAVTSYGCYPHIFPYGASGQQLISNVAATGLTVGNTYYLMIDGFGGANSTFRIEATSGINVFAVSPTAPSICAGQSVNLTASGASGIYSWSPPLGLNTTSGATVTATPAATSTYTVTSASTGGCPITQNVTVTVVNPVTPVTGFSYSNGTVCANDPNPTLQTVAGFTTGGTFSAAPAGLTINPTTGAITLSSSTPGNYTITYAVAATGCNPAGSSTSTLNITAVVPPITGISYSPNTACANAANPTLNPVAGLTPGGTFTSIPVGLSLDPNTGAIDMASSAPGAYTITYTVAASGCNPSGNSSTNFTISPITAPVTSFSYDNSTVCANGSNPIFQPGAGFTTGGTFTSSPAGLTIDPSTGEIIINSSSAGAYTISYTVAATGCNPSGTSAIPFTITASVPPTTGISYSPATVCANAADPSLVTVSGFTGGGTFSATPAGLTLNNSTGAISLGTSTPGTYTITYSVAATGCNPAASSTTTFTITANTTPVTGFNYIANTVCAGGINPSLSQNTGFTTGGVFSASPTGLSINPATGAINVSISSPGAYVITYSVAAAGCALANSSTANFTIQPNTSPVTNFSYNPATVCANAGNATILPGAGFTLGGTFSASPAGLSINSSTGEINVGASTAGVYTITYSVAATGCAVAGSSTTGFTIDAVTLPVTGISYSSNTVCINGTAPSLSVNPGFTIGGTFSATPAGLSINSSNGAINLAASSPGAYVITYSVAANGCNPAGSSSFNLTISANTTPVTGFNYTPNSLCANAAAPALISNTGFAAGGTFSSSPAGLSIDATTGAINMGASSPGTYTITYTVAASGCALASSSTTSLTIGSNITAVTTFGFSANTVCANAANPTINTSTGFTTGGTFTSTPAGLNINASTGAINVAGSAPGNYVVSYTVVANGCLLGGSSTNSFNITATSTPVTNFVYSSTFNCANGSNPFVINSAGFTTGGTYTATPAGLSLNASTGAVILSTSAPGNYTVTYTVPASGCRLAGSFSTPINIQASSIPVTGFTYNTSSVCITAADPIISTSPGFTAGGVFSVSPAGLSVNPSTGQINLGSSVAGSYTITYSITGAGCAASGNSNFSLVVQTQTTPVTGISYTPATLCTNSANPTLTQAAGFTTGGTYAATPAGLSINPSTGAINIAASTAGNYNITYSTTASSCQLAGSSSTTLTISNSTLPVTGFNYTATSLCNNAVAPNLIPSPGFSPGGSFSATPSGLSLNTTTGAINMAGSTPGTYTIQYQIAANGCAQASNSSFQFNIQPASNAVTNFNYSPNTVCSNASNPTLQTVAGFTGGGQFTATPAGLQLNATTGAITVAGSTPGNYNITYNIAASGCRSAGNSSTNFTINATPNIVTGFSYSPASVCLSTSTTTLSTATGFTPGGTFSASPAGLSIDANTGAINVGTSIAGVYTITYQVAATTCSAAASSNFTFTYLPGNQNPITGFVIGADTLCTGQGSIAIQKNAGFSSGGIFSASPAGLTINATTGDINLNTSTLGNYIVSYSIAATACTPAAQHNENLVVSLTPSIPNVAVSSGVCGPRQVSLVASSNGAIRWFSDAALINEVFAGANYSFFATNDMVLYSIAENGKCVSAQKAVPIRVIPLPEVPNLGADTAICLGEQKILRAGSYAQYLWQDGATTPTYTVTTSGIYQVQVTDANGCSASASVTINVLENCDDIYFAKAFSPNGDGINEQFGPMGNIFLVSNFVLKIFNRYGELVYTSYNPYQRWDGGNLLLRKGSENYVWYADYKYRGMKRLKKGNLLMVR